MAKSPSNNSFDDCRHGLLLHNLRSYDIICGRGPVAFNNIGNRRFRVMISNNLKAYEAANGRHQKGMVITALVKILMKEVGARFFKIDKSGNLTQLKESQIRQKVGHALRDMSVFKEKGEQSKKAMAAALQRNNHETSRQVNATKILRDIQEPLQLDDCSCGSLVDETDSFDSLDTTSDLD